MASQPWFAWEWLFDIVIGAIHHYAGLNGVVFFSAVLIALTFTLVLRVTLARGATLLVVLPLLLLAVTTASIHMLARPHLLSWLFAMIVFAILDAPSDVSWRRLLWLPLLMLLWANIHGGFLLGFVLLGCFLVDAFIACVADRNSAGAGAMLVRLAAVTGLSAFATFINPYGFRLYTHIYGYLSDRFLMDHINEFQSPNFHQWAPRCFALLLIVSFAGVAAQRGRIRPAHLLIALFCAYSGLYSSRNLPIASLLIVLIMAPIYSQSIQDASRNEALVPRFRLLLGRYSALSQRLTSTELRLHWPLWPVGAILVGTWICAHGGRLGGKQYMDAHFDANRFPVRAASFLASNGIRDPLFGPDSWGGYLIYRLYPANKVFVDDRHDLYGSTFFRKYLQTINVAPGWEKLLNDEDVQWVVIPYQSALANILEITPGWQKRYEDPTAVIYVHKKE